MVEKYGSLFVAIVWIITATGINALETITIKGLQQSSCGSWIPYGNEKCIHVVDSAVFQTKAEAGVVCQSLAEIMELDDIPRLVTVRTESEQLDLQKILFEEIGLLEPIWLGLDTEDDGVSRWNNGAEMHFNNLVKQNVSDADRPCVQMESGQGVYQMGQWVRVNCRKRNVVICEKIQVWAIAKLQREFLNLKSKVEMCAEKEEKVPGKLATSQGKPHSLARTSDVVATNLKAPSPCGDWTPYKDEKCVKIATRATHQDAEKVCEAFKEELNIESNPKLITIKTKEEQEFLKRFLFTNNHLLDNVWLGLKKGDNDSEFKWNDGSNVHYANWANYSLGNDLHHCGQMAFGDGLIPSGVWVKVNCKRATTVVCERPQTITLQLLQNMFLEYKTEQKVKSDAAAQEITNLKKNPVPVNFIYVQLPGQQPPSSIWPQVSWSDVSAEYKGLFFRVIGGSSAPFGELQESRTSSLLEAQHVYKNSPSTNPFPTNVVVPSDSSWSEPVVSNRDDGLGPHWWGIRFRLSNNEIRPRNKAVKVWKRTK